MIYNTPRKRKLAIVFILLLSGMLGLLLSLFMHQQTPATETLQTFHFPATFVKQLQGDPRAGEKIFKEFCASCHAKQPKIDIKAPRIGNRQVWKGNNPAELTALLTLTINGIGAMPARGGCFECSDEQLLAAIKYIVKESKKKSG